MVAKDFGLVGFPLHCLEGLAIDCLPVVDCFLRSGIGYFLPALVGYWGLVGWENFVVQTPVLKVLVEYGRGLERLELVVHSKIGWV